MPELENTSDVAALTVQLLSAYLANNTVPSADLADLIRSTKSALTETPVEQPAEVEEANYTPAVSARKSLASTDHIISMIDGKPYKALKRHLTANGLTPEAYRERYNLPSSYPMVAPTFAAKRREIAERIGLGNKRSVETAPDAGAPTATEEPVAAAKPAKGKQASAAAAKPRKPSVRKAKGAAEGTTEQPVLSAPIASKDGAGDKVIGAAAASRTKAARPPEKPKTSGAKSKPAATPKATVKPTPAIASAAAEAGPETPAPAKTSKRRGKPGLVGQGGSASDVDGAAAAEKPQAPAEVGEPPKKLTRAKRMARVPKAAAVDAAKTSE